MIELDLTMAATALELPVTKWGTIGRSLAMPGTYHFYTADYKFSALAGQPEKLAATGCKVAVEPNFSTRPGMDPQIAAADVARKRAIGRRWQALGIRLVVDLNVEPEFRTLNARGIPAGWPSFAVRCQAGIGWDQVEADHELARSIAGGEPALFAVFGGGTEAREYCEARGWAHVPEHLHVVEGRVPAYGSR